MMWERHLLQIHFNYNVMTIYAACQVNVTTFFVANAAFSKLTSTYEKLKVPAIDLSFH